MEIMRCATAPRFLANAIFSGATYTPLEAAERGWVHDVIEEEQALLDRAVEAANALAALPPSVFALSKRQTREPALERMKNPELDAAIEQIWNAPETLTRVRDYVARTLRK
jgi:enoyl-CoA hydratase